MSAIYGLVRFDGAAVDTSELAAMGDAMRYWGPDGGGTWTSPDRSAALGQLVSHNLPESIREAGPIVTADGSVVVAAARLDNRDDLVRELGLDAGATESMVIAAAWTRWGSDAPPRLYGDWAFAAWHPLTRRLFIARDHLGNTALYYHRMRSGLAFASSRKALFALPFVPRQLNELRLAQHLAMWVTDGHATFHEHVLRLPSSHHLTMTADGVAVTKYWFPERIAEIELPNDAGYIDRFRELYTAAVRTRLRTRRGVVTTLSAGLDSSSVTALARRERGDTNGPLIAFTSVPIEPDAGRRAPGRLVDEWDLARETAAWAGGIDHRPLRNESITPVASFARSLWLHDEPEFGAANLCWVVDLLEQARDADAGVLLSGQLGNGGVSWAGDWRRVMNGLRAGRWIDAARALAIRRRAQQTTWPRAVSTQIVRPALAIARNAAYRRGWILPPPGGAWFADGFAERLGVFERMRRDAYDPFQAARRDPVAQRLLYLLPGVHPLGALWHEHGAGYGLEGRDPTADIRLLEFCLAVPDAQWIRDGTDRALMRRAMEGILPPAVRHNRRRGVQGADLGYRFRRDQQGTAAAIDEVTASPVARQYLNVDRMRSMWSSLLDDRAAAPLDLAAGLARMLLIGLFLAREPFGSAANSD